MYELCRLILCYAASGQTLCLKPLKQIKQGGCQNILPAGERKDVDEL